MNHSDGEHLEPKNQRVFIIGNPAAGRGKAIGQINSLEQLLAADGFTVTSKMTSASGDVQNFIADLPDNIDMLAVVGGDGTINEVLNSLEDLENIPIAILPSGGANILARDLCLPLDAAGTAKMIRNGKTRSIDTGLVDARRRFGAILSVGFDATVVKFVQEKRNGRLGMRGYLLPILRTAIGFKPQKLCVSVDDSIPATGTMVIVANTPSYAGILNAADRAHCDSGHLDIVVMPKWGVFSIVRYIWAAYHKRLSKLPEVTYLTGRKISIRSAIPADVEIDGEYYGTTPVDISIGHKAANFLVPR